MAKDVAAFEFQTIHKLLDTEGPVCLIIRALMGVAGGLDRFQPAGFPEVGHVIYDAPRSDGPPEKICIVDSPASMANHLEQVCMAGENGPDLHADLAGLPYVKCLTDREPTTSGAAFTLRPDDPRDRTVTTSLSEGHRIASDYFLDGLPTPRWVEETRTMEKKKDGTEVEKIVAAHWEGESFRDLLRKEFQIIEVKKDKTYFIPPDAWWSIYRTLFKYDPNSLVHGVLFAKEQIRISRLLTAHLEALGAARVGRSGVKFDRLGKTTSGQPIFAVDEETAREIRATFIIDLALLRSYGREVTKGKKSLGLTRKQKELLLALTLWKIRRLLSATFSYRSGCKLRMETLSIVTDGHTAETKPLATEFPGINMEPIIAAAEFPAEPITIVYYPFGDLFKPGKADATKGTDEDDDSDAESED
jgi:CRISPR-associated protein Csb1